MNKHRYISYFLSLALLALLANHGNLVNAQSDTGLSAVTYPAGSEAIPVLHEVWNFARDNIYPRDLAARFDNATLSEIEQQLRADNVALADAINPFLESLNISHTRFYDRRQQGYYVLRSLFSTRNLDAPQVYTIGVQLSDMQPGLVNAVMEGSPAAAAGIQRDDRLLTVNTTAFESLSQWQQAAPIELTLDRQGEQLSVTVTPVLQGFQRALVRATRASEQILACGEQRFAYLHLWSGTHPEFLTIVQDSVANALAAQVDGFILDLRDGFGGAWWPYLDSFYADRSEYFVYATETAEGRTETINAEPQNNSSVWSGPLVVLTNSGTRSGKESLAFQFKKGERATVIGSNTAGAFTAGMGVFADRDVDYILYLSVQELIVDDTTIEGLGVAPDIVVADRAAGDRSGGDGPLRTALTQLGCGSAAE